MSETVDIVVDQFQSLTDDEKLLALVRVGARPTPLANNIVKVALRLQPGRERKKLPPVRQRPRDAKPKLIRRRASA